MYRELRTVFENLGEVPELNIEALPLVDGLREAPIIDRAEIAYFVGISGGSDLIEADMRYVLGRDTKRGRLYAVKTRDFGEAGKVKFDPEIVRRNTWLDLDSIKSYKTLTSLFLARRSS